MRGRALIRELAQSANVPEDVAALFVSGVEVAPEHSEALRIASVKLRRARRGKSKTSTTNHIEETRR